MDRRQRKSREAIFAAFSELMSAKHYTQITVGEIIEAADVGRATFYAHFETKDYLLKEMCEELFCHIFDAVKGSTAGHRHIFDCDAPDSAFLHLFQHMSRNDHHILDLLSGSNNDVFLRYFKAGLVQLIEKRLEEGAMKETEVPLSFLVNHIAGSFVETLRWWMENKRRETPEEITRYFMLALPAAVQQAVQGIRTE